jgi:UrcA family protein
MKTLNLTLYAVPVALLVMASGLANQTAAAEPTGQRTTFEARFVINPDEPAEKIYAGIKRTAEKLCSNPGPRPLSLLALERECAADLVNAAVARISRPDIAAVHARILNG